jgi:RND family efflux transporter MFP subunit
MKLKTFQTMALLAMLVALWALPLAAAEHNHDQAPVSKEEQLYTCGMHPQVIQKGPGNCPICGMKLTPILKSAVGSSQITIDPVTVQNMGFRSEVVTRGPLRRTIRTVAAIDFDETHLVDVTTKFKGWIEKLYVDSTGQQVHREDPLFEIYSPDLYSAQVEYILALDQPTNFTGADVIKTTARAKLKFYDISDKQIEDLERTRTAQKTLQILSPADGFVVEKMVVQGQMVDSGMKLYRIADLALVWVQAEIYEQDLPFIKLGQEAEVSLSYLPDRKFRGRVTYVYPTLDEKTRTARVRMEFHNPGYLLKPGMFATVELKAELAKDALLVPDMAVLRSGEKNTVFVALDGGKFEPRVVTLGPRGENNVYQVLSGLNEGDRVVTSGQFMLDTESQLREAIAKMIGANQSATNPPTAVASVTSSPAPDTNVVYICPMPEHVSIRYDHPGRCELCGMTLVPVSETTLEKIQPGGHIEYYTCPMTEDCPTPNHGVVHLDKPGKCPVCGMTLIPVMEMANPAMESKTNSVALPSELYTCPMASHADVVSDKPGDCPKCGMALVPTSTVKHGKIAEENWLKQHEHPH